MCNFQREILPYQIVTDRVLFYATGLKFHDYASSMKAHPLWLLLPSFDEVNPSICLLVKLRSVLEDFHCSGTAPPLTARTFSQKVDCQPLDIPSRSSPTQATDRNLVSGTNAAAKQSGADCGSTQNSATHSRFAAMGLDREVCVFSRADLEAAMPSGRSAPPFDLRRNSSWQRVSYSGFLSG